MFGSAFLSNQRGNNHGGLCKYYGQNQILEDVTMSVPSKSIYGLIGENGAGKTTLAEHIFLIYKRIMRKARQKIE